MTVVAMQRFGVRSKLAYVLPGLVVWGGTYAAGVHPTIAGVVLGFITPVRAWLGTEGFVAGAILFLSTTPGVSHALLHHAPHFVASATR